jgi:class 3 adenylate cyclase
VDRPETRYAWNGDVSLAYQVVGDGPFDLVYLQGWISNVEMNWENSYLARFLRELATLGRVIIVDRRGWGCSERFSPSDVPPMETLTEDLQIVMDVAGSERAVLVASFECTLIATLFAAAHPERAAALVLIDPWVTFVATDETPWENTPEDWDRNIAEVRTEYPPRKWVAAIDEGERAWLIRYLRSSVAPGALVAEFRRLQSTDTRAALPLVQVPTLVFAATEGDDILPAARFISDRISGSRLLLHPGTGEATPGWQHWYGRADAIVRDIRTFLGEIRSDEERFDRVLATVLFTDVIGSASFASGLGDEAWRDLIERHHTIVRALLSRYRGTEVDTAGDGFFATFDGPARAIRCAQAIIDGVRRLGIEVRAGLHTGECETIDGKAGGLAVVIGARVGALAGASEVIVSQTVKDLVAGSGLTFEDAGEHELRGVPDMWRLYRVVTA